MSNRPDRYAGALLHYTRWAELGVHSRRLAGPEFLTVFPGYHTLAESPATVNAMAWTLQNRVLPGSVLSHSTAALLWGIAMPARWERGIGLLRRHVAHDQRGDPVIPAVGPGEERSNRARLPVLHCRVPPDGISGIGRGADVHRWHTGPTGTWGRLVLSSPAETLRELATGLPDWDLVAAIESVVGPDFCIPGITLTEIAAHAEMMRGRRGTARLRRALRSARGRVRSSGESLLRLLVTEAGFPEPTPNLPVRDPVTGRLRYIDLGWEPIKLGLEYDGDGHRVTKDQWREDEARRDELASHGWTLARSNGDDIANPLRILLRLERTMSGLGMRTPSPAGIRRVVGSLGRRRMSLQIRC